jgi:hypothetical protein
MLLEIETNLEKKCTLPVTLKNVYNIERDGA